MRLIDADKLGQAIDKIRPFKDETWYSFYQKVLNCINKAPTITIPVAELDTTNDFAEWIDVNGDGSIMKCSKCGEEVCCKDNNFCPNCGADMRVKNELNRVSKELNSEIEKSKSEICPCIECSKLDNSETCRKGCSDYQRWKEGEAE